MANKKSLNKKGSSKYEKWAFTLNVVTLITNVILTGFNLYLINQNIQIRMTSLEFQSMMYNFTSVIIPNVDYAFLDASEYSYSNGKLQQTTHYGYLNVTFQVITPHYGTLIIRLKSFNVGDSPMLDSERRNETKISYAFEDTVYEYIVVSGLNHINDRLHLKALVYPNPDNLPPQGESVQFPLGRLFLEAELFDLQTQQTLTKEFSARILAVLEMPP